MRDVLPYSVTPMLMGNNKCSRRLARRLFWRLGLKSSIFDTHSSRELKFMLSSAFFPLSDTLDDEFLLMGLESYAREHDDMTCLLVPCSNKFEAFIRRNRQKLENRFIIRSCRDVEHSIRSESKMPYAKKGPQK